MANNSFIPNMFDGSYVSKMGNPQSQDPLSKQYEQQRFNSQLPYTQPVYNMFQNSSMQIKPYDNFAFQREYPQAAREWDQHLAKYRQQGPYQNPVSNENNTQVPNMGSGKYSLFQNQVAPQSQQDHNSTYNNQNNTPDYSQHAFAGGPQEGIANRERSQQLMYDMTNSPGDQYPQHTPTPSSPRSLEDNTSRLQQAKSNADGLLSQTYSSSAPSNLNEGTSSPNKPWSLFF